MESRSDRNDPQRPRIPPGQSVTKEFPVLHAGPVHHIDPAGWALEISGLVRAPTVLDWPAFRQLPAEEFVCDIHCVTRWSKLDTRWKGVRAAALRELAAPDDRAQHVLVYALDGWTTNLPVAELFQPDVFFAYEFAGGPIPDEHGGPVRLIVPRLYFWKSAKWVTKLEFLEEKRLGYWEQMGYHPLGDPWLEQRYSDSAPRL